QGAAQFPFPGLQFRVGGAAARAVLVRQKTLLQLRHNRRRVSALLVHLPLPWFISLPPASVRPSPRQFQPAGAAWPRPTQLRSDSPPPRSGRIHTPVSSIPSTW